MKKLKKTMVKGVFYFSSAYIIVALLHFFTSVILIRSLGLFEYGLLVLALSFYTILASFLESGIGGVVLSDSSAAVSENNFPKAKTLLRSYMKFELVFGVILFFATLGISFLIKGLFNEVVQNLLFIIAIYLLTSGLQNSFSNVFYSFSRFRVYNLIFVMEALARFSLVLVFIAVLGEGILIAMVIYVASQLIGILVTIPSLLDIRNKLKKYPFSKEPLFKNMVKGHGKWVMFSLPLKKIGTQAHYWITEYFLGVNSVALLGVAVRGTEILRVFSQSFEKVLMPVTAGIIKNWERTKYLISRSVKYNLWGSIIIAIPVIVFAPLLIEIVFSEKYLGATPLFMLLVLTIIPSSLLVLRPLFYALKAQKYLFYSSVIIVTLIIAIDVILIWLFGLIGIGVSMILIAFISFLVRYKFIKKSREDFEIGVKNLFTIDDFDKRQFRIGLNKVKGKLGR